MECALTERERKVLILRYGISDNKLKTLDEIGKILGVTRERVRQIEAKELRKMYLMRGENYERRFN